MKKRVLFSTLFMLASFIGFAQDTTVVQTLTYDSTGRSYYFDFPDGSESYRKIIMQYNIRCKDGLVSTQPAPDDNGCGEWDYSCNTSIIDSTKTDSIKAVHPNYLISNFSGSSFDYTTQPTYSYYQSEQQSVAINTTNSEVIGIIGAGANYDSHPFNSFTGTSKTQYLITEAELTGSGLSAGDITGLKLTFGSVGENHSNFRINIKHTSSSTLTPSSPELTGFTNVYYLDHVPAMGEQQYNFNNYFNWDGTSNIIVEFTYVGDAGFSSDVESDAIANMGMSSTDMDYSLEFTGANKVTLDNVPNDITNEVTVSFWSYGAENAFSTNTSIFEAIDANEDRQMNVHLPWSNGSVYWDCGNDGSGYDRIDKEANMEDLEGQWNHWAFTKNATTGSMKIYLNGMLWHTGTGKTKPIDLESFVIGTNKNDSYYYIGKIDEFSVWNKELAATEIADYMYQPITAAHPDYANLRAYYNFNTGTGSVLTDQLGVNNATLVNNPLWRVKKGNDLNHNFSALTERPKFSIIQGDYDTTIAATTVLDSLINGDHLVEEYELDGTDISLVSSANYYQAGDMPIYNESGTIVGTVNVPTEGTLNIVDLEYYNKMPAKIEIMSFVTPYGLGLNLGPNGKTWEFDMTDYTTVLKGEKELIVELGNYQEDMDIKFLFIEGTPPRNVLDLKHIWRPVAQRSFTDLSNDKYYEPRDVELPTDAVAYKLRAAITGHGQEGEFIARTHYLNVNGGAKEVEWQVWKECAYNPVYPQGGTWVYDRAGWCPGMATDLLEYEIDPAEVTNNSVNLDYGINSASGDSRYLISCQIVSYGAPNFQNDAAIVEIKNPSSNVEFAKFNPACQFPSIIIQNTGANELNSLYIKCKMSGGYEHTQLWTGSLGFMEKQEVILQIPSNMHFWNGDASNKFIVNILGFNNTTDENPDNNRLTSTVMIPTNMNDNEFRVRLITNNMANHNSWELKDASGTVLYSRAGTTANTTYFDTVNLADGCYTFELTDLGQDGLNWWANTSQGTGSIKFVRLTSLSTLKTFDSDFGALLRYSFTVGGALEIDENEISNFNVSVYPNPAEDQLSIKVEGLLGDKTEIRVFDMLGKTLKRNVISTNLNQYYYGSINVSDFKAGEYFVEIKSGEYTEIRKVIVK